MHLWGDGPRTPLCIPEKNSDVRRVVPEDTLQCAIKRAHAFASSVNHGTAAGFVFRHPLHSGIPWLGCARTLLVRLCKRMGLQGNSIFTPHQFRAYLVNAAMNRGCALENVSKWFGHRNVNVTYRYYWTAPSPLAVGACTVVDAPSYDTPTSAPDMHTPSIIALEPPTDVDPLEELFGSFT
jgi:integrase